MPALRTICDVPQQSGRLSTKSTSNPLDPVASPHSRREDRTCIPFVVGPRGQACTDIGARLDVATAHCSEALVTSGCTGDEGAEPMNGADYRRDFRVTRGFSIPTLWPSIKFKPRPLRTKWQRARPNR